MEDLSQALVFYQMQQEPEHLRALLAKGGTAAVWAWAEKVEAGFRQSPPLRGLPEAEVAMEFYRTWTPGVEEEDLDRPSPRKKRLSEAEIEQIMSGTENLIPPGLYEALTRD